MLAFSNFEMGQLAFASATAASNCSWVMPGIFADTVKWDSVMAPAAGSKVMSHFVLISSAVKPAAPNTKLSFILKHPACAAATNSSGLVPTPSAKRLLKEYCVLLSVVLCVVRLPLPSLPVPFHTAVAFLLIIMFLCFLKSC